MNKKLLTLVIFSGNLLVSNIFACPTNTQSPTNCPPINEKKVAALFDRWNNSLKSKNPDKVVANYANSAVLLATLSNIPRSSPTELREYFVDFLKKSPVGHIDQRVIRFGCDWASDTGLYTFTLNDHGHTKKVKARYSYVYEYIDNKWLIVSHHSSMMPETNANKDDEV